MRLDFAPGPFECLQGWVVNRIETSAAFVTSATTEPAPFSAQNMNQRVPDGFMASRDGLGELFLCELRDRIKEFFVRPVTVVVKIVEISDCHRLSLSESPGRAVSGGFI